MAGKTVVNASSAWEKIAHWSLVSSCVICMLTGFGFMFRALDIFQRLFGFPHGAKTVHHFFGLVFFLSVILTFLVWVRDSGFELDDIKWFKVLGGYLIRTDQHFDLYKFNPGQKIFFWYTIFFGLVVSVTGYIMWSPFSWSRGTVQFSYPLHALSAFMFALGFIGHGYLGSWANPGSLSVITSGRVTRAWCNHHRPRWTRKMVKEGKLKEV
jgi:formate dehydrogenase gamma subunit